MFEVKNNEKEKEHTENNNGCISDIINDKNSMKIMDINMINMSKNKTKPTAFLPMDNGGNNSSGNVGLMKWKICLYLWGYIMEKI